jgi:hypothetical protein
MGLKQKVKIETKRFDNFGHVVVIGSSITDLTASRVLTDHFDRMTSI